MDDQDRQELTRLKLRGAALEAEIRSLVRQFNELEKRLSASQVEAKVNDTAEDSRARDWQSTLTASPAAEDSLTARPTPKPPPLPPIIVQASTTIQSPDSCATEPAEAQAAGPASFSPGLNQRSDMGGFTSESEPVLAEVQSSTPPPAGEVRSLEMRLGTYWLVRIGVVMVLTGLVFFGNLAYQNYISKMGPGGKVSLLYLASLGLLGAGWWWQRKAAKESLKNYAQVLFAGGLAAVYFTTYAAHHIPQLRVIESAQIDGLLLLACAGFMVWIADRKESEVLALFAVGLAYYTSIITRVGWFTLYSNLVLTGAAVFFLVRNRWAVLSFASLVASYAAYGFWRFFDGSNWHWASPAEGLWAGTFFLMSYWVLFSTAVFFTRDEKFAGTNRASFLTVNNGAFFSLFLLTMLQVQTQGFWKFALIYGGVLLVLAELARRVLASEPLARNAYLTQGLLLVTVGFISNPKLAGLQLALLLAAESVVLLWMGQLRKNYVLLAGAYLCAAMAVGWGVDGMRQADPKGVYLAMGLGAMMLANTLQVHRKTAAETGRVTRAQPTYFAALALVTWLVATWDNTSREQFPLVLAAEGLAITLSIYLLRVPELTLLGQAFVVLAQASWCFNQFDLAKPSPGWNSAIVLAITVVLCHWWQRQKTLVLEKGGAVVWQILYSLACVAVLGWWLGPRITAPTWLVVSSLLAVGLTLYGTATRTWMLAASAQIFMVLSVVQFVMQLADAKPAWTLGLAPIAALSLLSGATVTWFRRRPEAEEKIREPLLQLAMAYRWVALVMSIWWLCEYIAPRERIWLCSLLGLWAFVWSGLRRSRESLLFSAAYTLTALVLFWLPLLSAPTVYWPNLLAIVVLLAQRQVAVRFPERYGQDRRVHGAVIVAGGLSLWLFLSRWVMEQASGFYLTASWSFLALALFTCGIALRERVYRWLGLGVLACALGRVVIFDVWKLDTLYRILSFMALGIVLLVLGFIYNRFQEKIREWL